MRIYGVSVTLSSGAATTTSGGGHFSFLDVEGGTYTITISGFPADASFNATTAEVTIASAGQTAAANFSGAWIRTASLMGMVTVEGAGLPGITVSISGTQDAQMLTDDNGQYTFTGLRAGNYTVEITGYDAMGVAFSATSSTVTVGAGESKVWSFDGTYVRESGISGQVSVEGNGLSGVTVSLQGMGSDNEQMTDAGGQYTFSNLRAGEYQLAISGYDTDEYGFSTTSATVRVEHGRTANVPFEGIMLRTAAIMGQVSIEGEGLADVTVSLSGEGESLTTMTDAGGQYTFTELPAGNFAVGISGYDTDDYSFETTSKNVAVALGGTATVPFEGILLRTSGIAGRVSVDGLGLADVTVTLSGDDLEADVTAMTDATGQYAIAGLAEGDYTVAISGYDAVEYAFEDSQDVTLAKDATSIVNFTGKNLRTAAVSVMVTADGAGVAGVGATLIHVTNLVTQSGDVIAVGATGADGSHMFSNLLAGTYAVQISGADEEIDFLSTTLLTQVATDATGEITFAGAINRTASIAGNVTADGAGMSGVMVALSGGDDGVAMSRESGADGSYNFGGLRRGSYTVSITNPNEAMYSFANTSRGVSVGVGQTQGDVSFAGSLIMQSSINGQVSVGNAGLADVMVTLSGAADATDMTDASGLYSFNGLATGSYTVSIANPDAEEYSFTSMSEPVDLGNTDDQTRNFPGTSLRTASITVMVTAEGTGVASAVATLTKTTGKSEADRTGATGDDGAYTFENLVAGKYQVDISGTDEEIDFADGTSMTVDAVTDDDADAAFAGTYNRTASIGGNVTIDGAGMADVMVMLSGDEGDASRETGAGGAYAFEGLRRGDYTVSITNPNEAMYSFPRTEQDVDLGLGQEQDDISFAGSMIQQSSISGQVTVEGEALGGVTVTLGGAGDDTRTTGDDGLYAFLNLGSGDYTVSMANPDDAAYIFDTTPVEVDLGNSDDQTHNFGGDHTREASISGMLFVDELPKNNLYDEGEHTLAAAGVATAGVKVTLVGPTLLMRTEVETNADGMFTFPELRQGSYQLMLSAPVFDAVMDDFMYGGDASYDIEVGVGADGGGTQNLAFDITHQWIYFTVNLRSGADEGDALPGAMVTLFSDAAGLTQIGTGETDADGMASIRIARAGTTGNTVYAAIAAPAGDYHAAGGMQAVTWMSQYSGFDVANDGDIVNLKAEISFSGATITTSFGGGEALGGWAISVASDNTDADDAPDALGDDGAGSYSEVVEAGDLPVTYTVTVADNQDNAMDGGENYEATEVTHTHDGLSLPATMDAGMMEVKYTTQTLKVYVHHERDQVMGFTGNVLGGDARMSGVLDIGIRHIDRSSGRSREFPSADEVKSGNRDGVYTFTNVPASAQVIVTADVIAGENVNLLGEDELDAYTDNADNGRMGGAFGDNGGYHHTVELCPLMSDEGDQRHGECGTFAFVNTYAVHGQVWEYTVALANGGTGGEFAEEPAPTPYKSVTVGLAPVAGENLASDMGKLAGGSESYTSGGADNTKTAIKEPTHFDWGQKAAGEYKLSVPTGWIAKSGGVGATDPLGTPFSPLMTEVQMDVTPTTGYVYGIVENDTGDRVEGATVTANGVSETTDAFGRYRIRGFGPATIDKAPNKMQVTVAKDGFTATKSAVLDFAANAPKNVDDIVLPGVEHTTTISGTVRSADGSALSGALIMVDGKAPPGAPSGGLKSGDDGTYTATVQQSTSNQTAVQYKVTVSKDDYSFIPEERTAYVYQSPVIGIDFNGYPHGTITGTVRDTEGRPFAGVMVTATATSSTSDASDMDYTDVRGFFSLSVPFGDYTVTPRKPGYSFDAQDVSVAHGDTRTTQDFTAAGSAEPINVEAVRDVGTDAAEVQYTGAVTVTWDKGHGDDPFRYQVQVWDAAAAPPAWANNGGTIDPASDPAPDLTHTIASASADDIRIRVVAQIDDDGDSNFVDGETIMPSDEYMVVAIDETASNVEALRHESAGRADSLSVTWEAKGANGAEWRVAVKFGDEEEWYTFATISDTDRLAQVHASSVADLANADDNAADAKTPDVDLWAGAMTFRVDSRASSGDDWEVGTDTSDVTAKGS